MQFIQKKILIKKFLLIVLVFVVYLLIKINLFPVSDCDNLDIPVFNESSISVFNGQDLNKPVYIAYQGCVYDVTSGRDKFYGLDMEYNYLTGRDSTKELNIAGGGIIKSKYKLVGKYEK